MILKKTCAIFKSATYRDTLLISVMALGAGCGIVYEYIIAHYAGRILGSFDTAVYAMIGLMIIAMGVGAFYARTIKCAYSGFAWLEATIALTGGTAVLILGAIFSLAYLLPLQLQQAFGLHESIKISGGPIFALNQIAEGFPYLIGLILGILVGMEIPFIARIREDIYKNKIEHNAGTVYGADYIGGGLGAGIWIWVLLTKPIIVSAVLTALLNLILGVVFLAHFYRRIAARRLLLAFNTVIATLLFFVLLNGTEWMNALSNMLYSDQVVYSNNTKYQNLVITQRPTLNNKPAIISLFINGQLQFSSADEKIYHGMLVVPAMNASARHDNILIVGGGDGLAAREVFKWSPKKVTLVDLDPSMIKIFRGKHPGVPPWLSQRLLALNNNALNDPRMEFVFGDGFKVIESWADSGKYFDTIIVDLPDPSHPDLNKLYTAYFYSKLKTLLNGDGALVVQSTSPYHSKKAFISVGKTLEAAGLSVDQYHANVPSFGEWGWSIATKYGNSAQARLTATLPTIEHDYLTREQILAAFNFSKTFFAERNKIRINRLSQPVLYSYHAEGWRKQRGIFYTQ